MFCASMIWCRRRYRSGNGKVAQKRIVEKMSVLSRMKSKRRHKETDKRTCSHSLADFTRPPSPTHSEVPTHLTQISRYFTILLCHNKLSLARNNNTPASPIHSTPQKRNGQQQTERRQVRATPTQETKTAAPTLNDTDGICLPRRAGRRSPSDVPPDLPRSPPNWLRAQRKDHKHQPLS
jgi:hypothetical protein